MSKQYMPDELPKTLSLVLHTNYCYSSSHSWVQGTINHNESDLSGDSYICIAKTPVNIIVETPDDLKKMVINALEAEYHQKMFQLQEKIDSLLALEYQPLAPATVCDNELPF